MKVLLLTHTFSDFGDEGEVRMVYETSMALAKKGIEVFVMANWVNLRSNLSLGIKVYQVPFGKRSSGFNELSMFKVFVCSLPIIFLKRINIIHLISTQSPCPFTRFKIRPFVVGADYSWKYDDPRYGEDLRKDRINKNEEFNLIKKPNLLNRIWRKIAFLFFKLFKLNEGLPREVDLYICRATKLLEDLRGKDYPSKIIYVPHGVNPSVFYPIEKIKDKEKNFSFLFVGRISRRKGVEYLIKAFNRLYQKHKNIELILIGKGASSTIEQFKKNAGINIKFIGQVSSDRIKEYYDFSDVVVLPSLGEPCSLVAREAMACAKPVIATNIGGFPDLIRNGDTGLLVNPADENDLAEAMESLLLNKNLTTRIRQNAHKYMSENLTWDMVAEKIIKGYKLLLKDEK